MIVVGQKVRVTHDCWWQNSLGEFDLLGLEGHVYATEEDDLYVMIPDVGHVYLTADEVEVIG